MNITTPPSTRALESGVYTSVSFVEDSNMHELVRTDTGVYRMEMGIKDSMPMTARRFRLLVRTLVQHAKGDKRKRLAVSLDELLRIAPPDMSRLELLRAFAENAHLANYAFVAFKEKPKEGWPFMDEIALAGALTAEDKAVLRIGELVAREVNAARDLANTPGGDMTPGILAKRIQASARGTEATVKVLGRVQMEKLGMGAILGVAKGSKEEPKFIIVEYKGAKKKQPTVLVGKGITFDTGGLNLKPGNAISDMHLDMSGGAAVAHAVIAAARLKLPVHAVALIPAAENMPSGESYRPGDILRSLSGKTIEVFDTDAEGRIVLADALTYAARYKPELVVDVATLTGAAMVALGTKASALFSADDALRARMLALAELSGDYCWPLPMWEEYKERVKGRFGDVANLPESNYRYGGSTDGAMFLAEFAQGYPWVHIDMAPRMTSDKSDQLSPGATGEPVRMLVRLLESVSR